MIKKIKITTAEKIIFYFENFMDGVEIKDLDKKIIFPGENIEDFYLYLLGHCKTVPEVFELYSNF